MSRRSTREVMLERRSSIAKLALFGNLTQAEIGERLGIDHTSVSRHLKAIRAEWQQQAREHIEVVITRELLKLETLELEALVEWERSKLDWKKKVVEDKGGDKSERNESGGQCGDPRYLNVLLSIQERRAKLLGTDKPQKVAPTTPDGGRPYRPNEMTDEELSARIRELSAKIGIIDGRG